MKCQELLLHWPHKLPSQSVSISATQVTMLEHNNHRYLLSFGVVTCYSAFTRFCSVAPKLSTPSVQPYLKISATTSHTSFLLFGLHGETPLGCRGQLHSVLQRLREYVCCRSGKRLVMCGYGLPTQVVAVFSFPKFKRIDIDDTQAPSTTTPIASMQECMRGYTTAPAVLDFETGFQDRLLKWIPYIAGLH